jgi:hypothetical protein
MTNSKHIKPGAVARLRAFYNNLRKQTVPQEWENELRDTLKRKDLNQDKPKKIAKPDSDAELT